MDDTTRPDAPIHMDMPGWTDTYGFYSQAALESGKHHFFFKIDGYANKTLAKMDMYPIDENQPIMKMLTWPDVRVKNLGLHAEDEINIGQGFLNLSTRLAVHHNHVHSNSGLNNNRTVNPDMSRDKTRFLPSGSAHYLHSFDRFNFDAGIGYGERAPSVSEGYGYYLYNNHDKYEYMGDPDLKNERSLD